MATLVIAEHDNASVNGATLNTVTAAVQCAVVKSTCSWPARTVRAAQQAAQIAGCRKHPTLKTVQNNSWTVIA